LIGKPPFKGNSNYETFQLIQSGSLNLPDSLSIHAKDLIRKLLDFNSQTRFGTNEGILTESKVHPFFSGIDWGNLSSQKPPKMVRMTRTKAQEQENQKELKESNSPISERNQSQSGKFIEKVDKIDRTKLLEQQKSSIWSRFLFQEELIVHTGLIWKKKGLFSKKRQLILTDRPRLFYIDPDKMEIKGEIPWSDTLLVDVKTNRKFNIVAPNRTYLLEDIANTSQRWLEAVMKLQKQSKS